MNCAKPDTTMENLCSLSRIIVLLICCVLSSELCLAQTSDRSWNLKQTSILWLVMSPGIHQGMTVNAWVRAVRLTIGILGLPYRPKNFRVLAARYVLSDAFSAVLKHYFTTLIQSFFPKKKFNTGVSWRIQAGHPDTPVLKSKHGIMWLATVGSGSKILLSMSLVSKPVRSWDRYWFHETHGESVKVWHLWILHC